MKKRVLIALAFTLLFCMSSVAQDIKISRKKAGGFFVGINAGVSYSTFRTDYQFKLAEHRYGPSAGINLGYFFTDMLGIEAEARFVQEGGSYVPSHYLHPLGNDGNIKVLNSNITMNMIDIPMLFKLNLDMGDLGLQVFGGPTYTMLLSAQSFDQMVVQNELMDKRQFEDVSEQFKEYYFGAMIGTGISFATFGHLSSIELRYKIGLQTINDDKRVQLLNVPGETDPPASYLYDFSIQTFSLTYKFNFML